MSMPLIDALPPAPTPADPEDVFDNKAYDLVAALGPFATQANALAVAVESEVGRSKEEADRSQAQVGAATSEANRAQTEADRSEGEANRAYQAAADAVAVTTGGTASIDPEPGKIPIAGDAAAIKQSWVKGLEFELDALRAARMREQYGDGPYPALDLQFVGATKLDPRAKFVRASADWGYNSVGELVKYEANEPILDYSADGVAKGLRVWGQRTNLAKLSKPKKGDVSSGWTIGPDVIFHEEAIEGPTGYPVDLFSDMGAAVDTTGGASFRFIYPVLPSGEYVISFWALSNSDTSKRLRLRLMRAGTSPSDFIYVKNCITNETQENITGAWQRYYVNFTIPTSAPGGLQVMFVFGDIASSKSVYGLQLELGSIPSPYIPTNGSQVTVAEQYAEAAGDYGYGLGSYIVDFESAGEITKIDSGPFWLNRDKQGHTGIGMYRPNLTTIAGRIRVSGGAIRVPSLVVPKSRRVIAGFSLDHNLYFTFAAMGLVSGGSGVASRVDGLNGLAVGRCLISGGGGKSVMDGHIRSVQRYAQPLSEAQLIELTEV